MNIIIFTLIRYQSVVIDKINKENILERFKQGYSFLEKNRKIFIFGIFSYVLFAFTLVMIHILLPSYVHDFLNMGGHVYASSEIYYSFGAIFSGFILSLPKVLCVTVLSPSGIIGNIFVL